MGTVRARAKSVTENFLIYLVLIAALVCILFPLYWVATTAFKFPKDVIRYPPALIPFVQFEPTLENWIYVVFPWFYTTIVYTTHGTEIFSNLLNSVVAATGSSLLATFTGSLAAYGLARFEFKRWKNRDIAFFILSQRFLPPAVIVIPYFIMFKTVGLLDTWAGIMIAHTAISLPFVVWMMREYFLEVPREVEESAMIDGCGVFRTFIEIVLPVAKPGLVASMMLAFIFSWNEYILALFLTYKKALTLPAVIAGLTHSGAPLWWDISVMALVAIVPPILIALAVERYIVRGLTLGAVKG